MMLLILKLLLAHLIGDFVLQNDKWVKDKNERKHKSPYLYFHIAAHALLILIFLKFNWFYWKGIIIILTSHFAIDLIKLNLQNSKNGKLLFVIDQLAHLSILLSVSHLYQPIDLSFLHSINQNITLLLSVALITVSFVLAVVMRIVMSSWNLKEDSKSDSLPQAGKYIGMLERLFVFGFIVLNQWQGIGFLIAAKSIFRFSDLSRAKDRKLTEYILIGTLLSFGLAISIGLIYTYLAKKILEI